MTVALEARGDGVIIPVRVRAGGRRSAVGGEHDGALRVEVAAAPEKGKANQAVVELVAKTLGVAKSNLTIVSGETSSQKKLFVTGLSVADVAARLAARRSSS